MRTHAQRYGLAVVVVPSPCHPGLQEARSAVPCALPTKQVKERAGHGLGRGSLVGITPCPPNTHTHTAQTPQCLWHSDLARSSQEPPDLHCVP